MAVSSNSTALPARKPMGRRGLLRCAALAPIAALSACPAPAPAQTRTDVARRIHALAGEISTLLADLDEGMWEVRISPAFNGAPMFSVEPTSISALSRLNRSLTVALAALNEMRPGHWRKEICLKPSHAFVALISDPPAFHGMGNVS